MALRTDLTISANTKGFEAAERAVDGLNKKLLESQKQAVSISKATMSELQGVINRSQSPFSTGGGMPVAGVAGVAGRGIPRGVAKPNAPAGGGLPGLPSSGVPTPHNRVSGGGFGPMDDPEDLLPKGVRRAAGTAKGRVKGAQGLLMSADAIKEIEEAYNRATAAAVRLAGAASDSNAVIENGLPVFKRYQDSTTALGGGRGGGGGGGGAAPPPTGGGDGPRRPRKRRRIVDAEDFTEEEIRGKERDNRNAALLQGFLEGLSPLIGMMQRGPGITAQFAGRQLGGLARYAGGSALNMVGAAATAPAHGAAGLVNLVGSVPFVGGILGNSLAQQFGNASNAVSFEAQQMGNMAYSGDMGMYGNNMVGNKNPALLRAFNGSQNLSFSGLQSMGLQYGMAGGQAQGYLAQLARASGTRAGAFMSGITPSALNTSMAAQGAFDVGPEVMGMFLQGQRQAGGLYKGAGAAGFDRSLATGFSGLGLEGSELVEYMQQMAQDIASFKSTGIPIATDSIGALGMSLASSGISGSRSAMIAGNFQRGMQQVGMDGPQSADDFALLQAINGAPLKGIGDTISTMRRAEDGLSPGDTQKTFRNLLGFTKNRYKGGQASEYQQRMYLRRFGLNFNSREFERLSSGKDTQLSDAQVELFSQATQGRAVGNVSTAVARQATLENQSLSLGQSGLDTYFKSEVFSRNISVGIAAGIAPSINKINDGLERVYDKLYSLLVSRTGASPSSAAVRKKGP